MIEFKEENFKVYSPSDKLPEKFTKVGNSRLNKGETYAIIGFCSVPETLREGKTPIQAWEGVALQNVRTKKNFPCGLSTILGIGFQKSGENYKVQTVKTQAFLDVLAISAHIHKGFKVVDTEDLQVTPYGEDNKTEAKTFYILEKNETVYQFENQVNTPAKAPTKAQQAKIDADLAKAKA